ncbi:MAG: nitrate reductase molybdenum cofactor assembly chaperone [Thermoleophilia bacterium]|nr:nitrate reductase molybdenum cofactor assembly chaperone [Thermoleophilia bacterium]
MSPYKLLSLLLQYPTAELVAAGGELAEAAAGIADARPRERISRFLSDRAGRELGELQREYVATFDFERRSSLHLTYHTHGDRRQRGLELVRLRRRCVEAGLEPSAQELPDYLPALLELAALAPETGEAALAGQRASLELVRASLHACGSPYATLLDCVVDLLSPLTRAQRRTIERLAAEGPPAELVGLEPFGVELPAPTRGGGAVR